MIGHEGEHLTDPVVAGISHRDDQPASHETQGNEVVFPGDVDRNSVDRGFVDAEARGIHEQHAQRACACVPCSLFGHAEPVDGPACLIDGRQRVLGHAVHLGLGEHAFVPENFADRAWLRRQGLTKDLHQIGGVDWGRFMRKRGSARCRRDGFVQVHVRSPDDGYFNDM